MRLLGTDGIEMNHHRTWKTKRRENPKTSQSTTIRHEQQRNVSINNETPAGCAQNASHRFRTCTSRCKAPSKHAYPHLQNVSLGEKKDIPSDK